MPENDIFQLNDYNKAKPVSALFAEAYSDVINVAEEHPVLTTTAVVGLTAGAILITRGRLKSASSIVLNSTATDVKAAAAVAPTVATVLNDTKIAARVAPTLEVAAVDAKPLIPAVLEAAALDAKTLSPGGIEGAKVVPLSGWQTASYRWIPPRGVPPSAVLEVKPLLSAHEARPLLFDGKSVVPMSQYQQASYRWIPPRAISGGIRLSQDVALGAPARQLSVPSTEIVAAEAKLLGSEAAKIVPMNSWQSVGYRWIPPRGVSSSLAPEVKPLISPHEVGLSELGGKTVVPMCNYQQAGYRWIPPRGISGEIRLSEDVLAVDNSLLGRPTLLEPRGKTLHIQDPLLDNAIRKLLGLPPI